MRKVMQNTSIYNNNRDIYVARKTKNNIKFRVYLETSEFFNDVPVFVASTTLYVYISYRIFQKIYSMLNLTHSL